MFELNLVIKTTKFITMNITTICTDPRKFLALQYEFLIVQIQVPLCQPNIGENKESGLVNSKV